MRELLRLFLENVRQRRAERRERQQVDLIGDVVVDEVRVRIEGRRPIPFVIRRPLRRLV